MLQSLKNKLMDWAMVVRNWYNDSEVIFLSRATVIAGFSIAVFEMLNWSPMLAAGFNPGFTWRQAIALAAIMIVHGAATEWARRRRSTDL